jgi:acetyl-CoA carboxylase, biotin carboxylase subunit
MFSKILIANRGEIAVRIIRACKEMGIKTVAVYSQADRDALHTSMADESYCIGKPKVTESYLNMGAILTAAIASGCEAIHPGYGLLSENPTFVSLCEQCNIELIGPSSRVISLMGDKNMARKTMMEAGVPVVPGSEVIEDVDAARLKASEIGYPVLIKARSGGGGRGIRLVREEKEFDHAFAAAATEAKSAFGDSGLYLERFLSPVKHIEMQILADKAGNVVCLGERECSVQRKNQKLVEESPSPAITPEIREQMNQVATKAVKAVRYANAGTIEFLLDSEKKFYFMEMNTRLQVEHPVTEMVTGIDLVQWQIRIAYGLLLPFTQEEITLRGHSIECRINAEDPSENFRPQSGKITMLHVPGGPGVRFDSAVYSGYTIPPYYDSMIGKLIVFSSTRGEAIRKMQAALCELVIEGVVHTAQLQRSILKDRRFLTGKHDTGFLIEIIEQILAAQTGSHKDQGGVTKEC